MSCNCKEKIQEKFRELYPNAASIFGQYEMLSGRAYMEFEITMEGKKKPKKVPLLLSRCPHCGKPYDEAGDKA